eukprot:820258-Prymnesium_polylepis.2
MCPVLARIACGAKPGQGLAKAATHGYGGVLLRLGLKRALGKGVKHRAEITELRRDALHVP